MTNQVKQCTPQEFGVAMEKFQKSIAPAKLADSACNGLLIAEYIQENLGGDLLSQSNIRASVTAQRDILRWDVKPASLLRDEQAAKEAIVGVKPATHNENNAAEDFRQELLAKSKAANTELDFRCQAEIAQLIANVPPVTYGGKINIGATERRREGLRKLRATNTGDGSTNWLETLRLVKTAIDGMGIVDSGDDWSTRGSRHAERY